MHSLCSISSWIVSLCIAAIFMNATSSPSVVVVPASVVVVVPVVVVVVVVVVASSVDMTLTGRSENKC